MKYCLIQTIYYLCCCFKDGGTNLAELLLNAFPPMIAGNEDSNNLNKDGDARDSIESPTKWDHGKADIGTLSSHLPGKTLFICLNINIPLL